MTERQSRIKQWARQHWGIAAAVAVGVAIGGAGPVLVRAAIPDGNTVRACYTNAATTFIGVTVAAKGELRTIDSTETCPTGTTALSWDQHSTGSDVGGFLPSLVGAELSGADFRYRNFAGADMHNATLGGMLFTGSDFHGANLSGATVLAKTSFVGTNFHNTNFSGATMGNPGDMSSVSFSGDVTGANFSNAILGKVSFMGGLTMTGVNFTGAQLTKVNFLGTNLTPATLTGVTWVNSTCPDGTNSDANGSTCTGHLVP